MLTLYARKEPTTDPVTLSLKPNTKRRDVVLYEDSTCMSVKVRIPWYHTNCPRSRDAVVINCYKYNLVWVNN